MVKILATSKLQMMYVKKYQSKLDDIRVRVPIGKKEEYRQQAIDKGYKNLTRYIVALLENDKDCKENK